MTIDTSGYGYEEWLEERKKNERQLDLTYRARDRAQSSEKIGGPSAIEDFRFYDDTSGDTGHEGDLGADVTRLQTAVRPQQMPGAPTGVCFGSHQNGDNGSPFEGEDAYPGYDAEDANKGGKGKKGGDASNQNVHISETSAGSLFFYADGGRGGVGGRGGRGGKGGTGGKGADGGPGANCQCIQGGAGSGGDGGQGGPGGQGGKGGTGGEGGDSGTAGSITVYHPVSYSGAQPPHHQKTRRGPGGEGGYGGEQGNGGPSGNVGHAPMNPICTSSNPHDGHELAPLNGGGGVGPGGDTGIDHSGEDVDNEDKWSWLEEPGGGGEYEPGGWNSGYGCTDWYWVEYSCYQEIGFLKKSRFDPTIANRAKLPWDKNGEGVFFIEASYSSVPERKRPNFEWACYETNSTYAGCW